MQSGWMKLDKFKVHYREPGTRCNRNPISRGYTWVGGVEVGLPCTTRGK